MTLASGPGKKNESGPSGREAIGRDGVAENQALVAMRHGLNQARDARDDTLAQGFAVDAIRQDIGEP